uniref:PHD-type domain-containing protein n=1 Tax=Ascaris lumbricoides TaxID=6252 RepID=A0A0M3IAK1_ASCLU
AIEELTAPPNSCNGKTKKAPRWKPPGRWKSVNSQYCNACREGGELLCCDRCPSSFHLMCHEPPIERSTIPTGKWLCNRCTYALANNDMNIKGTKKAIRTLTEGGELLCCDRCPSSFHLMCHEPPIERSTIPTGKWLCNRCTYALANNDMNIKGTKKAIRTLTEEEGALLTEAGRNDAAIVGVFERMEGNQDPLAVLADAALAINAEQFALPVSVSKDVMSVPFEEMHPQRGPAPLKAMCHICSVGSEDAPLLQCDFCPLCYHLDCLNPPLAVPPKDRWMCPAHVEHFTDRRMLTSLSITERMRLWKKHARQPVEEFIVKMSFIDKTRAQRQNVSILQRNCIEAGRKRHRLPRCVKDLYRKRWKFWKKEQLPSKDEQEEWKRWKFWKKEQLPSKDEQEEWFEMILRLQRMKAAAICQDMPSCSEEVKNEDPLEDCDMKPIDERLTRVEERIFSGVQQPKEEDCCIQPENGCQEVKNEDPLEDCDMKPIDERLTRVEERIFSGVQQPKEEDCCIQPENGCRIFHQEERLLNKADKVMNSRDELIKRVERECLRWMEKRTVTREQQLIGALAFQRLQQITAASKPRICDQLKFDSKVLRTNVPVLAVLKAGSGDAFPVQQMRTSLGANESCDVDLTLLSPVCTAIAAHHADLVFNRVRRRFELSPVGVECICVDGVFYSESESTQLLTNCACSLLPITPMRGTAPLKHGSIINIGCVRLIFASLF